MSKKPKMKRLDYTCDECKRSYHTAKGLEIHQDRVHNIT
jgi:hypothetical protein